MVSFYNSFIYFLILVYRLKWEIPGKQRMHVSNYDTVSHCSEDILILLVFLSRLARMLCVLWRYQSTRISYMWYRRVLYSCTGAFGNCDSSVEWCLPIGCVDGWMDRRKIRVSNSCMYDGILSNIPNLVMRSSTFILISWTRGMSGLEVESYRFRNASMSRSVNFSWLSH